MVIREKICNEFSKHRGGQSCETKLRCPSKPRDTLLVGEGGITGEGYKEGGQGTPDKELYYQRRCRHEDKDLAARINAFGRGWKSQGVLGESGWEI